MADPRVIQHAKFLVNYSTKVRKGDKVVIQISDEGLELASEIYKESARLGAHPVILSIPSEAMRVELQEAPEESLKELPRHWFELAKNCDVYFTIRSESNTKALANVDSKRINLHALGLKEIQEERLSKRWCGTQHPTEAYAQEANMSLSEYRDFVYGSILIDWSKEMENMLKLKKVMDNANVVRLVGERTDLIFSIKGRNAVASDATHNVPSGEVFTAPVDDSANGRIFFDLPAIRTGKEISGVELRFERGDVVEFTATKNEDLLRETLNVDAGASRLGEFGIGTNRRINRFTKNILFDEKIGGTIHLALGRAYKECRGVNDSAIHWDMIKTMKPGKILMDDQVVQEDGIFFWERT